MTCPGCGDEQALEHQDEHPGLCCDCFDESFGMDEEHRTRPRKKRPARPRAKEQE